jgi:LysM repeat protein
MNTTNPFNSSSSQQEQKNKTRARFRLAVFVALGLAVAFIVPMLVQGCKREDNSNNLPPVDTNPPPAIVDTNAPAGTNLVPALPPISMGATNPAPLVAPLAPAPITPSVTPAPAGGGTEYTVVHGDSFYTIGKKNGVSIKAIEDANPGVDPKKLKVGQKLQIPASAGGSAAATGAPVESDNTAAAPSSATYTVKSGDTLTRIAKTHGTTVKAIKAENNLTTDRIKVGQKLKIPVKDTTPVPTATPEALVAPAPANVPPTPMPAPVTPTATH